MRITGGRHRSRLLVAPRGDATRPTSDRVREALFGILGSAEDLSGHEVLDLYAGTGALAFEALSRGAARATLVEPARKAIASIRENARALGVEAAIFVVPSTVERAASTLIPSAPYDLIFADPPYAQVATGEAPRAIGALLGRGLYARDARLVLEHSTADTAPPLPGLSLTSTRRYGDTSLSFYGVTAR